MIHRLSSSDGFTYFDCELFAVQDLSGSQTLLTSGAHGFDPLLHKIPDSVNAETIAPSSTHRMSPSAMGNTRSARQIALALESLPAVSQTKSPPPGMNMETLNAPMLNADALTPIVSNAIDNEHLTKLSL